ncbi:hypothetical protein C2845_PM14G15910 [Panicum miliaceum]|uniref:Uncharacterized protein n=1 Tax=Panicum miliaceum TaxID=4540 RepID=A0A3L6PPE7_PANMI|nr:hypothetical protein C2845_PM14G15910 [Panicum miliaceum]
MAEGHTFAKRMGSDATSTTDDPKSPSNKATLRESNQPDFSSKDKRTGRPKKSSESLTSMQWH